MSISPSTSSHVVSDDSLGFVANIRSLVWFFGGSFDFDVVMCACRYNPILFFIPFRAIFCQVLPISMVLN